MGLSERAGQLAQACAWSVAHFEWLGQVGVPEMERLESRDARAAVNDAHVSHLRDSRFCPAQHPLFLFSFARACFRHNDVPIRIFMRAWSQTSCLRLPMRTSDCCGRLYGIQMDCAFHFLREFSPRLKCRAVLLLCLQQMTRSTKASMGILLYNARSACDFCLPQACLSTWQHHLQHTQKYQQQEKFHRPAFSSFSTSFFSIRES